MVSMVPGYVEKVLARVECWFLSWRTAVDMRSTSSGDGAVDSGTLKLDESWWCPGTHWREGRHGMRLDVPFLNKPSTP